MVNSFYQLPIELLAALAAAVFVGFQWLGSIFLRPILRAFIGRQQDANAAVAGIFAGFGVLYGLLLSLLAVAAYQNQSEVRATTIDEASSLLALYRDVSQFPGPDREALAGGLERYCRSIIDEEWPVQRAGKVPEGAHVHLLEIRSGILGIEPESRRDELLQELALEHYDEMTAHGRERRYAATTSIPSLMWYVVIVGTIISFVLGWVLEMRLTAHFFFGGLNAFFLGALILLIAVMERPFRSGTYGVSPKPFETILEQMNGAAPAEAPPSPER